MRTYISLLVPVVALVACQPSTPSGPNTVSPAQFELRDFKVVKAEEEGRQLLKGRGTLISKDPRVAKGSYIVWLSVKKTHQEDREQRYTVVVTDGVGNLETRDPVTSFEALVVKPEFKEWKILGYAPLIPAELASPRPERAASQ